MFLDGSFSSTGSQRFSIAQGESYVANVFGVASNEANGDTKVWQQEVVIKNVGGTVSFVGSPGSMNVIAADAGMSSASMSLQADNTNDALVISVQGISSTNIRWTARLEYVMLSFV